MRKRHNGKERLLLKNFLNLLSPIKKNSTFVGVKQKGAPTCSYNSVASWK